MKQTLCLAAVSFCVSVHAAHYRVEPLVESRQIRVTVSLDKATSRSFRLPAWAPGDYEILNFGKRVQTIQFSLNGGPVEHKQGADPNLWMVDRGADTVVYTMGEHRGNFSPWVRVRPDEVFISGAGAFGWFAGDENRRQTLEIVKPVKGAGAACALDVVTDTPDLTVFRAANYEELIDSPVAVSQGMKRATFTVAGKKHEVAVFGRTEGVDPARYVPLAQKLVEENVKMFGDLPYARYVFLGDVGGGGGGLEHRSSTKVALNARSAESSIPLLSHEFFHVFNVKVIRPKPLGPFDLTKPAITGSLWWLEGVTDYYAYVIAARAGLITHDQARRTLSFGWQGIPAVSAEESSRRVWEARGSQGFGGVSYYMRGRAIGLGLDLAIRAKSQGQHSLDDVMKALYAETKDGKPGYEKGRIRELCVLYGGQELGPLYDQMVTGVSELPLVELARQVGWTIENGIFTPTTEERSGAWPSAPLRRQD